MIHLIRRVRINDRIPTMYHNDVLIKNAYRKETLIVGEYEVNPDPSPYAVKYFCIESLEDNNTITFTKGSYAPNNTYYVSTDLNTWTEYYGTQSWTINTNGKLYFKANASRWFNSAGDTSWNSRAWHFYSTNLCNISGNIMSLFYGDDFAGKTVFPSNEHYLLHGIFREFDKLFDSKYLVLPTNAYTLPNTSIINGLPIYCYSEMFYGCTSLVNAPLLLPATTLGEGCYSKMFYGCTSLVNAPNLPATTLDYGCYNSMFYGCTSLVNAPVLPATTLVGSCYYEMFRGCTSLVNAPVLPATTLAISCYKQMFVRCSSLNYIKCLATDISASGCVSFWVSNVSSTGTFVKAATMNSWPSGNSGIPSNWTVQNA